MILDAALFVSKRLQRIAAALICLAAMQLAGALMHQGKALPPGAVRVFLKQ